MNNVNRRVRVIRMAVACSIASLAACGGGGTEPAESTGPVNEVPSVHPSAATVQRTTTQYTFALAQLSRSDNQCYGQGITVYAYKGKPRANGTSTIEPAIDLYVGLGSYCSGEFISEYWFGSTSAAFQGYLTPSKITFSNEMSVARAKGTVELIDGMGGTRTATVDLAWEGGEFAKGGSMTVTNTPNSQTVIRTSSAVRTSRQVTGSVTFNGVELWSPTNASDLASVYGYVISDGASTIEVVRTP